jgi:Trypsin-like peptidase domain
MQAMVLVEGDKGKGSGFIARMEGKTYVITNSHVIRGSSKVTFKTVGNKELSIGPLQIADHADLVRAEVTAPGNVLEILQNAEQVIKIGDEIMVVGNSEGAGVVREIKGKVTGIGPDRIEVDAPFVPGNSGSPILTSRGAVVGVATYLKMPRSSLGGSKTTSSNSTNANNVLAANILALILNEVRRFGYRLDTVSGWVNPNPPDRVFKEGMKLADMDMKYSALTAVLSMASKAISSGVPMTSLVTQDIALTNPAIRPLAASLDEYTVKIGAAKELKVRKAMAMSFFESLKSALVDDVRGFNESHFSGYNVTLFKERLELRRNIYKVLDSVAADVGKMIDNAAKGQAPAK